MIEICAEQSADGPAIETLLDTAFGTDRFRKSSYGYRQSVERLWPLCLTAHEAGSVVGTLRCWPIRIGDCGQAAILIGPVAVDPAQQGQGLGSLLMRRCIAEAHAAGYGIALLVGDAAYYGRFGFLPAARSGIVMARENPARVLALPLDPAVPAPIGLVQPWRSVRPMDRAA
jgi:predicted N-acetyltransferase YhbS